MLPRSTRRTTKGRSQDFLRELRALRGQDIKGPEVEFDKLSKNVIGCAIEVHKALGPGLLESAYEQCLAKEFLLSGIRFHAQVPIPIKYKGIKLDCGYRIDMLIDEKLILELKSVDKVQGIHEAQILTYMKLANIRTGLLINFNVAMLKEGIKRFVL
jgi:GxxExxY protein